MKRVFIYNTEKKYFGRPIKDILHNKYSMSSGLVTNLKKTEYGITVNGEHKNVNYLMNKDDILKIIIEEGASENIVPIEAELDILYEDQDILAVNKPYNMPTHTSMGHHTDTLANAVLHYLNKSGSFHTFHAITRLDMDTSGIVLIAKNRYAHDMFSNLLKRGKLSKTYNAVVCGKLSGQGVITADIERDESSIIKRTVCNDGQKASTCYRVKYNTPGYSFVEIVPETGRTHQIRVHMASIGYPLVGDLLYDGDTSAERHLLHCRSIRFYHPILRKKIAIYAKLPDDMVSFCDTYGLSFD